MTVQPIIPVFAAAAVFLSFGASADESPRNEASEAGPFRFLRLPPVPNLEGFSSTGASPAGAHASYGFKWAFAETISRPGWMLTGVVGSGSSSKGTSEIGRSKAFDLTARVMAGRQETFGRLYVAAFLGPETRIRHVPAAAKSVRRFYGLRAEGHLWYRPSEEAVYGWVLSAGSVDLDVWSRVRAGRKIFDLAVIGPEAILATDTGRSEIRLGFFVAELRLLGRNFELGGGGMRDTEKRSGWYGTLAHITRF